MTTLTAFIRRHPVATYFILTFAISWGGLVLAASPSNLASANGQDDAAFMLAAMAMLAGPSAAGLLLTGITAGRAGYRELLARLWQWRVKAGWYALALLLAPLVTIMTDALLALLQRSPEYLPAIFAAHDPVGLLLPGLAAGVLVGFCEELGWTGFAIPRLRPRYGILVTGLLVGVLWGAWHFLLFLRGDSFAAALPLALLVAQLFSWLPATRIVMVWVYDHTQSLLVVMLMHASQAATALIFAGSLSDAQLLTAILVSAAVWWVVVGVIAVANRGHLSQQPLRRRTA